MLKFQENVPLANYTSLGIGGPARYFVEIENTEDLQEAVKIAKEKDFPFFVLGGGSNVLVSDAGFSGVVIKIKMKNIEKLENGNIRVGAGVLLSKLVSFSAENSLIGLEWASGIPGMVGGAVVGNAGTAEGEMKDSIKIIEFFDVEKKEVISQEVSQCEFAYRSSCFKGKNNLIILNIELSLTQGDKAEIKNKIEKNIADRKNKQPQGRSVGSYFKNPVVKDEKLIQDFEKEKGIKCKDNKIPAGWLIEKADLKGKQIGGAQVSDSHGNFILNVGNAKAQDFLILASLIKQKVRTKYGVQLQEEIQYVGF